MDIAVAIPTYNHAELLRETLDAILNQRYPAAEIMVVDDGSTDHTPAVLAEYAPRVKSLRIANSGPSMARKVAAEATTSPWLAFCDHDDLWLPEHLERRVALLSHYPHANFSFADAEFFGPGARPGARIFSDDAPKGWWEALGTANADNCLVLDGQFYRQLLAFNPAWPSTTVLSRELYNQIGGIDPRYSRLVNEDADMTRKAVLHGQTVCDFTITSRQRRYVGNTSGSVLKSLLGKCQILEDHITLGIAPPAWHGEIRQTVQATLQEAFLAAYYAEDLPNLKRIARRLGITHLSLKNQLRFLALSLRTLF